MSATRHRNMVKQCIGTAPVFTGMRSTKACVQIWSRGNTNTFLSRCESVGGSRHQELPNPPHVSRFPPFLQPLSSVEQQVISTQGGGTSSSNYPTNQRSRQQLCLHDTMYTSVSSTQEVSNRSGMKCRTPAAAATVLHVMGSLRAHRTGWNIRVIADRAPAVRREQTPYVRPWQAADASTVLKKITSKSQIDFVYASYFYSFIFYNLLIKFGSNFPHIANMPVKRNKGRLLLHDFQF